MSRKPLVLRGARQVGKTTAVRSLGESFDSFVELNFEEAPELNSFFEGNLDPKRIVSNLANYLGVKITPEGTLLFFDEIQYCPRALLALRYFFEKWPSLHVIAAGSLIEFELEKISFPVGRVEFHYMYPLNFEEFLGAMDKERLLEYRAPHNETPEAIHRELLSLLRDYTVVGGLPEVVNAFRQNGDFQDCQDIQSSLIETFLADFPKYAKRNQTKYLSTVFNAIPLQLGRKLKYSHVSTLYKSRELSQALELLEKAGLLYRVFHSSGNGIPLEAEKDARKFKVIFFDTGLALRMLRVPIRDLMLNPDVYLVNEGAIAEQLVGQEFISYGGFREKPKLDYWHREAKSSNAEIDYLLEHHGQVLPIEVKSGRGGTMKSMRVFLEEKKCPFGVCVSQLQGSPLDQIRFIPPYVVGSIYKNQWLGENPATDHSNNPPA